jgi:cell fate regulator YaaT (PSP1 superfamily)
LNKIVGVQFRDAGKSYDFDCGHFVLKRGDMVMVVTEEGPAVGRVVSDPQPQTELAKERVFKKVYRIATPEEVDRYRASCELEESIYTFCLRKISERGLPMNLVCVERRFDGSKTIVYFTAEGRVDFRELVKDLVREFRAKIEMRQIGVRHQAKMVGGIGTCGRTLCCGSFLTNFAPVTIKMAKEQNLSLNPSKISGMCGRLMCCLAYEHGLYEQAKKVLPKVGKMVKTKQGEAKVIRQNVLTETITVVTESGEECELKADDVESTGFFKKKKKKE